MPHTTPHPLHPNCRYYPKATTRGLLPVRAVGSGPPRTPPLSPSLRVTAGLPCSTLPQCRSSSLYGALLAALTSRAGCHPQPPHQPLPRTLWLSTSPGPPRTALVKTSNNARKKAHGQRDLLRANTPRPHQARPLRAAGVRRPPTGANAMGRLRGALLGFPACDERNPAPGPWCSPASWLVVDGQFFDNLPHNHNPSRPAAARAPSSLPPPNSHGHRSPRGIRGGGPFAAPFVRPPAGDTPREHSPHPPDPSHLPRSPTPLPRLTLGMTRAPDGFKKPVVHQTSPRLGG